VLPIAVAFPTKSILIPLSVVLATTSAAVAVWVRAPLVPVIVRVAVPAWMLAGVVMFSATVPEPVTVGGFNDAETPAGAPLTWRVTEAANPFSDPTTTE
jgi:hypothetical protein